MLDYPLADIIDLMRQHIDKNRRAERQTASQVIPQPGKSRGRVIYREAGDDWF